MANIKLKIKGIKQITINGNYNSLVPYSQYKDDAKMADTTNAFTDYLSSSGCNPNDDKIVIKQLPDKGSLFYLTNPAAPTPVYAVVTLGQSILVKDILVNKVLKFQAEGLSDNAFTGTYMTTFKFERLCGNISNNVVVIVNFSMVDEMKVPFTISETLRSENQDNCGHSYVEFEVNGDVINMPIKLKYNGAPSGASVDIVKIGTGIGAFRYANNNAPFDGEAQEKDGSFNVFSQSDLLLTNTGKTKFRLQVLSSDTIKNLITKQLVTMSCVENEGDTSSITIASASLLNNTGDNILVIQNKRTMYYPN